MTRSEVRATLVVLALVVVAVIALWPRGDGSGGSGGSATGAGDPATSAAPAAPAADPAELAAARARAALAPCPVPVGSADGVPALAGLSLDCLGEPGEVSLAGALGGRATLVNLWASWCGPCREEIPAIAAYSAQPGAVGVLGVAVGDTPTSSLSLLSTLGARYPSVSDPDRAVIRPLGVPPVLPASAVVRPDGAVVPLPPEVFRTPEAVRAAVDRALAAAPGTAR